MILKDPDHGSLAFIIALVDPVLLMDDEEVPCFVNGHDQVGGRAESHSSCSYELWSLLGMEWRLISGWVALSSMGCLTV